MAEPRKRRMMRRGSIPLTVHGLVEYGVGVLSIAAPFLFSFETDAATLVSILLGVAILLLAVVTAAPTGVVRNLPLDSHIVIDYVLVLAFITAPFAFGFSDDGAALAYFLIVGVAHLMLTVMTRFHNREAAA